MMPALPKSAFKLMRQFFTELGSGKFTLLLILVMGMFDVALHGAIRYSSQFIIDKVLPSGDFRMLVKVCFALLGIALLQIGAGFVQEYSTKKLTGSFILRLKRRVMKHLQKMPLVKIQELKVGGAVTRLQSDTEGMGNMLSNGIITPLRGVIMLTVGLTFIFTLNAEVALWYLFFGLTAGLCALGFMKFMRPRQKSIRSDLAGVNAWLTESLKGFTVIRSFTRDLAETLKFTQLSNRLWRKQLRVSVINIGAHRFSWAVYWGLVILLWLVGGYFVTQGKMTIGQLVAFHFFAEFLFDPVFMILHSISELQTGLACTERTFELLEEPLEFSRPFEGIEWVDEKADVCFEDISFHYPGGITVLSGIHLVIPHAQTTAIVGPSGAGKSTVLNLLMRFYSPSTGQITINNTDIGGYKLNSYRQKVGVVEQEVLLFDGTIRDNIAFGKPQASLDEIHEAAKLAACFNFIQKFQKGFDTRVGENGVNLSGGERQRIALARTLLLKPEVLLLDEATSQLDVDSEHRVYQNLSRETPQPTVVVVAHRISTIKQADKIVVIEGGRITQQGTHQQLMEEKGYYANTLNEQRASASVH